jgi:hypothetical protein
MNLMSSFLKGAAEMAVDGIGFMPDDSPDGWLGLATSALAGVAAAFAVAIILTVYFRRRYRSTRDMVRHGLAVALVLGLIAFVVSDMRHAALAYLGINPTEPAVEFEIRMPRAAALVVADGQVELHTDQNQVLARLQGAPVFDDDGRSLLRGSVPLQFRTTDRVMILNLPGQALCEFRLRLAASPTRSDQFGPWHLADRVAAPNRSLPDDTFAIRYRVV